MATQRYYLYHLATPLLLAVLLFFTAELIPFDVWLSRLVYDASTGEFPLRHHWLLDEVIHTGGRVAIMMIAIAVLGMMSMSWFSERVRPWRRALVFIFTAMVVCTSTIVVLKYLTNIHCPYELSLFGGDFPYVKLFGTRPAAGKVGKCWPSGHASGGYSLLAFYFVALKYKPKWRSGTLLFALVCGSLFGIAQTARGLHFLSHVFWTLLIIWLINVALARTLLKYPC